MQILTLSTASQKCFLIDTAADKWQSLPYPKAMSNALRLRKRADARPSHPGVARSAYSRRHDCLVTTVDTPSRIYFHHNFSKHFAQLSAHESFTAASTSLNVDEITPEGKAERRQRLKKERLERRGRDAMNTQPFTAEIVTTEDVRAMHVHPSGDHCVTGGARGSVHVYDIVSNKLHSSVELAHLGHISTLSVSDDEQKMLTSGADEVVRLWKLSDFTLRNDTDKPTAQSEFHFPKMRISHMRFFPFSSNIAVFASLDGFVRCLDLRNGSIFFEKQFGEGVSVISFSPCMEFLLVSTASGKTIALRTSVILGTEYDLEKTSEEPSLCIPPQVDSDPWDSSKDIFVRMALEISQVRGVPKMPARQQRRPKQMELLNHSENESASKTQKQLCLLIPNFTEGRVTAMDASGAFLQWDMSAAAYRKNIQRAKNGFPNHQTDKQTEKAEIQPLQTQMQPINANIDYVCSVGENFLAKRTTKPDAVADSYIPLDKTNAGIDVKEAFKRPITMDAAKQKMHEKRAKQRAVQPPPALPVQKISEEDAADEIPGMIRFDQVENFGEVVTARLRLKSQVQKLREEIFELERVANDLKAQKEMNADCD